MIIALVALECAVRTTTMHLHCASNCRLSDPFVYHVALVTRSSDIGRSATNDRWLITRLITRQSLINGIIGRPMRERDYACRTSIGYANFRGDLPLRRFLLTRVRFYETFTRVVDARTICSLRFCIMHKIGDKPICARISVGQDEGELFSFRARLNGMFF